MLIAVPQKENKNKIDIQNKVNSLEIKMIT